MSAQGNEYVWIEPCYVMLLPNTETEEDFAVFKQLSQAAILDVATNDFKNSVSFSLVKDV